MHPEVGDGARPQNRPMRCPPTRPLIHPRQIQNRPTKCPPTRRRSQRPAAAPRPAPASPTANFIELSLGKGRNAKAI